MRFLAKRRRSSCWMLSKENELKSLVATAEAEYKADLGGFDPDLQITVEKADRPEKVLDTADASRWSICWSRCLTAFWR